MVKSASECKKEVLLIEEEEEEVQGRNFKKESGAGRRKCQEVKVWVTRV